MHQGYAAHSNVRMRLQSQGTDMETISSYMGSDHQSCDALFAQVEARIDAKNWAQAEMAFISFYQALERHFSMEEEVLFPAFEKATGSNNGPTSIMRNEHQQLRAIASLLNGSVLQQDSNDFFDHADTLRIMMEQHNLKEETILYGMTDRVLFDQRAAIIYAMAEITATTTIE